jgi:serine-type D-Ala-D-Ala carboxypeptidase
VPGAGLVAAYSRGTMLAKSNGFAVLRRLCERAVSAGVVPGAVVLCAQGGTTDGTKGRGSNGGTDGDAGGKGDREDGAVDRTCAFHEAFGARQIEPGYLPTTIDTVYDVASVTKAVVTSVLTMRAVATGQVRLDDLVARHLPEFRGVGKASVSVRQLLCHASGLPAHRPFYGGVTDGPAARLAILNAAAAEPLIGVPGAGSVYTDLGFMLLGWLLERATGVGLDLLAQRTLFEPLGLGLTTFVDRSDLGSGGARARLLAKTPVAATERCPVRGRVMLGEVHDLNAFAMGGIAGHAGLFSDALGLGRIASALVAAWHGGAESPIVERDVIREFWRPAGIAGSTWRLGWDGPAAHESQAGSLLSRDAVGHLGFTGCSLWIDPARSLWIVLLTNRVHPTAREDSRFKAFRAEVHDAAWHGLTD